MPGILPQVPRALRHRLGERDRETRRDPRARNLVRVNETARDEDRDDRGEAR